MDFGSSVLGFLASVTIRAVVLGFIALVAVGIGRIRSAAALHAVCAAVVAGMLALAALTPMLPPLALRVLQPEPVPVYVPPAMKLVETTAAHPQPTLPLPVTPLFSWQEIAAAAYGVVVVAFLIRLAFGYLFTRRLVRASRAVVCPWPGETYESTWISVPLTVGWLRPKILLPAGWKDWPEPKLDAVMAHERTHVRRGDWAIAVMSGVNRCLFWFNPVAWWLERRLAFLAEQACDDSALLEVGSESYAQALLEMAAAVKARHGRLVWEAMAMANVAEVRHRIERILDETRQIPKGLTRSRWAALVLCSLPLIYVASVLQLAPAEAHPSPQEQVVPRKSNMAPTSTPFGESMKVKDQLTASDAAQMEAHLATNPHDLDVRSQLVVYYFDHNIREPRLSHIFWLIANHPESTQAVFTSKGITPRTSSYNDASDYARAAGLWKQQAAGHAGDPRVLSNAADFLSRPGGEPDEAERLLMAARKLQPGNLQWTNQLARLYTSAIVGSAGDPSFANTQATFAARVKPELEGSTDGQILSFTGRMLANVAIRLQPGQKLPNGVLNLDEHPMLTPVVEMGNRLLARTEQFGGGVPGIVVGVPSGQAVATLRESVTGVLGRAPSVQGTLSSQREDALRQLAPGSGVQGSAQAAASGFAPPPPPPPPLLNKVDPMYPALARQARIQGDVKLKVQIGPDGHIQTIEVVSGHPLMVPAALDAVKQWVYAPVPSPVSFDVTVPFRLDGGNAPMESLVSQGVLGGVVGGVPGGVSNGVANVPPSRIRIGGAVQAAKLASSVDPVYPEAARAAGIEGEVVLDVTIGDDGHVRTAVPRDGNAQLATAAAEAVRQWVYKPTLLNGTPVAVLTTVTVPFKLQQ